MLRFYLFSTKIFPLSQFRDRSIYIEHLRLTFPICILLSVLLCEVTVVIHIGKLYHKYRVIRKSLRDFRPLRYSSRDGHAEGEHVNRGRDTLSFCPTLQVLDMSTIGDAADVNPTIAKIQNVFLFPVHAMFRHDCPLAVKTASTLRL